MVDREDQSNLPPIPDGGLTEAMPDWLRRPPAWRALPDREVTMPEPDHAAELPEPDESVIDPRTFLSDDDLPEWLNRLGRGRALRPSPSEADVAPAEMVPAAGSRTSDPPGTRAPARFVPASPPIPASSSSSDARQAASRLQPRQAPAASGRQGIGLVALLAVLLLIAIAVIVILLVA